MTDKLLPSEKMHQKDSLDRARIEARISQSEDYSESRGVFKTWHAGLKEAGHQTHGRDGRIYFPGHPDVAVTRKGDVFGRYQDVRKMLDSTGATGKRTPGFAGIEAHHLVEHRLLKYFGFTREEGASVAVYSHEHMELVHGGGATIEDSLSKGLVYDIDEIVEVHEQHYRQIGRPEWGVELKSFVRENSERILHTYEAGGVPGSTKADYARVKAFLEKL